MSLRLGPILCNNALQVTEDEKQVVQPLMQEFAALVKQELISLYPETEFPGMNDFAIASQQQLIDYKSNPSYLTDFVYRESSPGPLGNKPVKASFSLPATATHNFSVILDTAQKAKCNISAKVDTCQEVAKSFKNAVKPAFQLVDLTGLKKNKQTLGKLQKDWQLFIDDARYQTPLDVWFTTQLNDDHFNGPSLVGPPTLQYFLLRPSLVYEHIDELENGERDHVSLAIEWFGINHWKSGIGASFTTIYNDRENTSSIGKGITVHVQNKYSVGFVHRSDGNHSLFVNIDLLEVFFENEDVYKKYKRYF